MWTGIFPPLDQLFLSYVKVQNDSSSWYFDGFLYSDCGDFYVRICSDACFYVLDDNLCITAASLFTSLSTATMELLSLLWSQQRTVSLSPSPCASHCYYPASASLSLHLCSGSEEALQGSQTASCSFTECTWGCIFISYWKTHLWAKQGRKTSVLSYSCDCRGIVQADDSKCSQRIIDDLV